MTAKKNIESKKTLIKASHRQQLPVKDNLQKPGPIQFVYDQESSLSKSEAVDHDSEINQNEFRNYECKNYDCCLNIVAALDWEGFSCQDCNGEINQNLLWRAQGECAKDESIKLICELPDMRQRKIEAQHNSIAQEQGLRLVVNNTIKKP